MIDKKWLAAQLIERQLVTRAQAAAALQDPSTDFCLNLLSAGAIQEHDLLRFLGLHFHTRYVTTEKLGQAKIAQWVIDLIPGDFCQSRFVFPVRCDKPEGGTLSIVTPDPSDDALKEEVRQFANAQKVDLYIGLSHAVEAAVRKWYKGDIHAFSRLDQSLNQGYPQMLDIYDQRLIDFDESATPELPDEDAPLELVRDQATMMDPNTAPKPKEASTNFSGTMLPLDESYQPPKEQKEKQAPLPSQRQMEVQPSLYSRSEQRDVEGKNIALRDSYFQVTNTLVSLLEMGKGWRQGHSTEVARLSRLLAEKINLSEDKIWDITIAALLHEIGMPQDPHLTLLSLHHQPDDRVKARKFYQTPINLLEAAQLSAGTIEILQTLYERLDGTGIPGKKTKHELSVETRLLQIVDAFIDLVQNSSTAAGHAKNTNEAIARLKDAATHGIFDLKIVLQLEQVVTGNEEKNQLIGARPKLLLIDADIESTTVLELKLVAAGYDVSVVSTTAEAAREVLAGPLDLILSEIDLKPVDGFGFLQRIRSDARTKNIPLIYLSSRAEADDVNKGFAVGAADYIVKPYNPELLLAKVRMALTKKPAQAIDHRGVSGSLKEMSFPDILQILSAGQKSGLLTLKFSDAKGEIFLEKGQVIQARYNHLSGEKAFYALLPRIDGHFDLDPNAKLPAREIHMSTEGLILEATRRFDEANR